jgi:hypothetical protein
MDDTEVVPPVGATGGRMAVDGWRWTDGIDPTHASPPSPTGAVLAREADLLAPTAPRACTAEGGSPGARGDATAEGHAGVIATAGDREPHPPRMRAGRR